MTDVGPPLVLTVLGLILWLAVDATLAGISIQTIGVILAVAGIAWLLFEVLQSRGAGRREVVVHDRPVVREREIV